MRQGVLCIILRVITTSVNLGFCVYEQREQTSGQFYKETPRSSMLSMFLTTPTPLIRLPRCGQCIAKINSYIPFVRLLSVPRIFAGKLNLYHVHIPQHFYRCGRIKPCIHRFEFSLVRSESAFPLNWNIPKHIASICRNMVDVKRGCGAI